MKRKEVLQKTSDQKIDVDFIIEQDQAYINKAISDKKFELSQAEAGIKKYLTNPSLVMDEEFVALVTDKSNMENKIAVLRAIKEDYL